WGGVGGEGGTHIEGGGGHGSPQQGPRDANVAGCPRGDDTTELNRPCCCSSGSAIPVHAMPATDTISVLWRSRRSPSVTASARGGGAFRAWGRRGPSAGGAACRAAPAPTRRRRGA